MGLNIFFYLIIFIFGLIVGSFLNCLIYRLEKGESFFQSRSYCPDCKKTLLFWDLIPLLSFIILKGKCRYCQKPISLQYPLVELATAILFVLTTYNLQLTTYNLQNLLVFSYLLFVICCLLFIFVYDLKYYIIPDKIIYPAIIISFLYQLFLVSTEELSFSFLSAIGAAVFFLAIVLISQGKWLGMGDVKLAFFMGLFLGWPKILVALFFAFFLGALIGIILIASGKKTLKSEVPFGPFLVTATFIGMFFGQQLINWYQNFFLL